MSTRSRKWIQSALGVRPRRLKRGRHHRKAVRVEAAHKGALHRQLGVLAGKKIPLSLLRRAVREGSPLLRRRAQFALNVRGLRRKS